MISAALYILPIIVSIALWFLGPRIFERKKAFSIAFSDDRPFFLFRDSSAEGISVLFEGEEVENLHKSDVFVWNGGAREIKSDDIITSDHVRLVFPQEARILRVSDVVSMRRSVSGRAELNGQEVFLYFDLLDKQDGFSFSVFWDRSALEDDEDQAVISDGEEIFVEIPPTRLKVEGVIAGQPSGIKKYDVWDILYTSDLSAPAGYSFIAFIFAICFVFYDGPLIWNLESNYFSGASGGQMILFAFIWCVLPVLLIIFSYFVLRKYWRNAFLPDKKLKKFFRTSLR